MTNIAMQKCKKCSKLTSHYKPSTSHVLHLLLSLISLGLWIPIWILVAILNSSQAQCSECGHNRGVFG